MFPMDRPIPRVGFELRAPLIQGNRMPEVAHNRVRSGEREPARNDADRVDCIPKVSLLVSTGVTTQASNCELTRPQGTQCPRR
jgi:hypothetical protein